MMRDDRWTHLFLKQGKDPKGPAALNNGQNYKEALQQKRDYRYGLIVYRKHPLASQRNAIRSSTTAVKVELGVAALNVDAGDITT